MIKNPFGSDVNASSGGFQPRANIPRSTVQGAVEYIADNAASVSPTYAPTDAEYLTKKAETGLSNERVVTDTATITWDWATSGQGKANFTFLGIEDLSDPGAGRLMGWKTGTGAVDWYTPGTGMGIVGNYLSITDADIVSIIDETFSAGDMLWHDGTQFQRLPLGAYSQYVRVGVSGPEWVSFPTGSGLGDMLSTNNLAELTDKAVARTVLGVEIGADVQAWDADLDAVAALSSTGIAVRTSASTWAQRAIAGPVAGISVSDGDGVGGNPTIALANDLAALEGLTSTGLAARTAADTWAQRSITAPAAGITVADGDGVAGNPTLGLANDLAAVEGLAGTGIAVRTATDTWAQRSVTGPAAGITVSNGDGVSGNPTLALANDLSALEGLSSTGIAVRTGTDAWAQRTVTGTANEVSVANGDGVSGNPTISLPSAVTLTGKTLTGGTFSGPAITGTADVQQAVTLSGDISPSQITADQNDYAPTGFSTASVLRLSTDAARTLTGLAGGSDGRVVVINNVGSYAITLSSTSTASTAANRFAIQADVIIAPNGTILLQYDATSSRWRALGSIGGEVPPGTIVDFCASSAPSGYFKANGAAVSRATYANLFAAIGTTYGAGDGSTTFNLPDLRGEFRRGLDDGRGVDASRALGSSQSQNVQQLTLATSGGVTSLMGGGTGTAANLSTGGGSYVYNMLTNFTVGTGTETRPRNVALLACIKY